MIKEFEEVAQERGLDITRACYYEYEAVGCRCRIHPGKRYEDGMTQLIFEMCEHFYKGKEQ